MCATLVLLFLTVITFTASEYDKRILTTLKYSKNYVWPMVINGLPAEKGQVPYLVSIKEPLVKISELKRIWVNICGGSIISPTKVLTAAHCFEVKNFYYFKHPEALRIVAGNFSTELIHSGNTDTTNRCQWRKISSVKLHKNYYFPDNDLALVIVSEPWRFSNNVDYVRTARRNTDYMSDCISAGFGSITHKKQVMAPVLLIGHMHLLPKNNCSLVWEMNMDKYICTYSYLSDVSRGDSGGPLSCRGTLDPFEKRGQDLLVGVVSGKNFDKTTLFTRVSAYKDWINSNFASRTYLSFATLILNYVLCALY